MGGALIVFHDLAPADNGFRDAVLAGMSQSCKAIPCRFLYDERGSALFDAICELPEYYLTRAEISILNERTREISVLIGAEAQLIEFGSGSSRKIRILLAALAAPAVYIPVDISREHLRHTAEALKIEFPDVSVIALCADYTRPFRLPLPNAGKRVGVFPGSTIGNFEPKAAQDFLSGCAQLLGPGSAMMIGVDLKKDPDILHAAYNDHAGVTAAFNLNLLGRANRELDADFDLDRFEHEAFYNEREGRIEIYIRSRLEQTITVSGRRFRLAAGERIHTEYSYEYGIAEFQHLAAHAGFRTVATWTDHDKLFSVHYLTVV